MNTVYFCIFFAFLLGLDRKDDIYNINIAQHYKKIIRYHDECWNDEYSCQNIYNIYYQK